MPKIASFLLVFTLLIGLVSAQTPVSHWTLDNAATGPATRTETYYDKKPPQSAKGISTKRKILIITGAGCIATGTALLATRSGIISVPYYHGGEILQIGVRSSRLYGGVGLTAGGAVLVLYGIFHKK